MNKEVINKLGKEVCLKVLDYFESKENRKAFEDWYYQTYKKHYEWKRKVV